MKSVHKKRAKQKKCRVLFLLIIMFVFASIFPVLAKKTTEEKLAETNAAIEKLQAETKKAKQQLDAAKKEQNAVGERLDELDTQLSDVQLALSDLEKQIAKKNEQMEVTEQELDVMRGKRTKRYEEMKVRIRFMYENSDTSLLDTLFGASSMSELLNRVEYFSQIVAYDRAQLKEYQQLVTGLNEKQALYEGQKEELLTLQQAQKQEEKKLTKLVASARTDLKAAGLAASDASDALDTLGEQLSVQKETEEKLTAQLAYEKKLEAQKAAEDKARMEEIKRQEEELRRQREEEERRRQEEEKRRQELAAQTPAEPTTDTPAEDAQQPADDGGSAQQPASMEDLELLACIIQCEAEGEPYAGKLAVGSVVLNRVASSSFPNTIMGVIYQSGQFSPVASGRMAARLAAGANSECRQAAQEVLNGNITVPYLYFRVNNGIIDGYVLGNHVFY